jgi:TusA-related sulfurtransferase
MAPINLRGKGMLFNAKQPTDIIDNVFAEQANGNLTGLLSWDEFDEVCERIKHDTRTDWFVYNLDEQPPLHTTTDDERLQFITSLNTKIHTQYAREHCGIAFTDSVSEPGILKIFNPKLLKSICNVYGNSPVHGWVISREQPIDLHSVTDINSGSRPEMNIASRQRSGIAARTSEVLDARHTGCPLPIINTCRALQQLSKGQLLEIMTIEPGSVKDISIICEQTGDRLISHEQTCDGYSFFVEKMA